MKKVKKSRRKSDRKIQKIKKKSFYPPRSLQCDKKNLVNYNNTNYNSSEKYAAELLRWIHPNQI